MRKTFFAILACCLVVTSAFSQTSIEFKLSEDKTHDEEAVLVNENEHGHFFIRIAGDPDRYGRIPVQIELENNSYLYSFFLFDRPCNKKELKKNHIFIEDDFVESSKQVQNIKLTNQNRLNEVEMYSRYTFPELYIEEGQTYECKIPLHLIKPKPGLFCKKRKSLCRIIDYTIRITVDQKDTAFDKFSNECQSLLKDLDMALNSEEFCTNPLHKPSFDEQTADYTRSCLELKTRITRHLNNKGWSKDSQKYQQYQALLTSLDQVNRKLEAYKNEKHDCGGHVKKTHSCQYCKLSLKQIYDRLDVLYQKLYVGEVKKSAIMKEVNGLYKCCTDPTCKTHAQQWKNDDMYKSGIIEFYEKIKNFNDN